MITNKQLHLHMDAVVSEFKDLHKKFGGFSFWEGPRHFVATETAHNDDGLHFAWPGTLLKTNMVKYFHFKTLTW